jgi:hypothetical protein
VLYSRLLRVEGMFGVLVGNLFLVLGLGGCSLLAGRTGRLGSGELLVSVDAPL